METFKARKREIVRRYNEAFKDVDGLALINYKLEETFPFFYIVRVLNEKRDTFIEYLKAKGIGTGVHYIPNHIHPVFAQYRVPLPVTEQLSEEILTLPLYYDMTEEDVDLVIKSVTRFFNP